MTLRTRLMLTWAAIVALFLLTALYGLSRLTKMQGIAEDLQGYDATASVTLGRLQTTLAELDRYLRSHVAYPDPELRENIFQALETAGGYLETLSGTTSREAAAQTRLRLRALGDASREVVALVDAGRSEDATSYLETVKEALAETQVSLDVLAGDIDRRSAARVRQAQDISSAASTTTMIALAAAFLIATLLGFWTTRVLTSPLRKVRGAMSRVADGDFVVPAGLPYERRDEIGDLARSFRTMTGKLAELDRMKAEFISVASHELKTPLNVIGGYAELLDDGVYGDVSEEQREALDSIRDQTRVLTDLVNQILDISRIEAGGFHVERMDVESRELFGAVRRMFEPLAKQKGIQFDVVVDDGFPTRIHADPDRLRNEVLGNLLSNAFKFTPEGGEIRVDARSGTDGDLVIHVRDSGSGIPEEQLGFIFEKFYQVGSEARVKGSGLGLAIAREIVESHEGSIEASSRPGQGTTFTIHLPAALTETEEPAPTES